MITGLSIPAAHWAHPAVKLKEAVFSPYGVPCTPRAMTELVGQYALKVKEVIGADMQGKLFNLKLDIASRKGRRILGISAQYLHNWRIKIAYLGMREITGPATADNIRQMIKSTLANFGLSENKLIYMP